MKDQTKQDDKSTWAVAGGLMIGLGLGFFYVQTNPMAFVGCTLGGLGLGLLVTSIISALTPKE